MFTRIIFRRLSRNISFMLIGSLVLSTVGATYPQDRLKKAFGSAKGAVFGGASKLASTATNRIKGGLSSAFNNVKQMDRTVVIDRLQKQVESLGQKIGYMGNCMAKGTCSQAERTAFIATSVTVLALTVAVVGGTLSVAATSKEVESVTRVTSQEVQGWGPQQVFQRLANTTNNFKRSLSELKQGMLKKELTRGQKKFLYGAAISIAALVTIAVGAVVASYLYAEKKESEQEKKDPLGEIQKSEGAFGQFFDRIVRVKKEGSNFLQQATRELNEKLEEANRLARHGLQAQADVVMKQAKTQAQLIASRIKQGGPILIKQALSSIFGISYEALASARQTFDQSLGQMTPKLDKMWKISTWNDIQRIQTKWETIQNMGYALWENLSGFLSQITSRSWNNIPNSLSLAEDRRKGNQRKYKPEDAKAFKEKYPLAYKYDALFPIYQDLLALIGRTDIPAVGAALQGVLDSLGTTLQSLARMHTDAGVWGKILVTQQMINPLNAIGDHLERAALYLKQFTDENPLAQLAQQLPEGLDREALKKWVTSVIEQPIPVSQVRTITQALLPKIQQTRIALFESKDKAQALSDTFSQHSSHLLALIEQSILTQLNRNPVENYLNVAKRAVLKEAKISKELLNDLLFYIAAVVNNIEKLISAGIATIENVNDALGKEFLTASHLEKLKAAAAEFDGIRKSLIELRQAAKESLPQ